MLATSNVGNVGPTTSQEMISQSSIDRRKEDVEAEPIFHLKETPL